MDWTFTEEQQMLRELARKFADEQLRPRAAQVDEQGAVPREVIDMAIEMGFMGVAFPEEYDGGGMGELGYCLLMEELARGCCSTAIVIGGHESIGAMAIYLAGTEDQKQRWLIPMARGELLGAFSLTEPHAGSDAASIRTTAVPDGDEWVLNGNKTFITNAGQADVYSVFAKTTPDQGTRGISAFIVPKDTPGFRTGIPERKMGIRGSHTADLFFEDARIPKENLLGELNQGFKVAMKTLDVGRFSLAAICLGQAKEALDMSAKHARERVQFGKPIGEQGAVKAMLADMATEVFLMESITYRTAWMCDAGLHFSRESAICKLAASEGLCRVVDLALQVHGGMGYMRDYPIERMYRDARIMKILEGTNEIQRLVIAADVMRNK